MVSKDVSYQIAPTSKIFKISSFPPWRGNFPSGSDPENIKRDYQKITHIKFDHNPALILGDTSQDRKIKISPSFSGKFPHWGV